MPLAVPLVQQPPHSADCGVACVAMLLEYYKVPYSYTALRQEIGVSTWGTSAPQLGAWLLKHGFEVEIVTMHPSLFTLGTKKMSKATTRQHFLERQKHLKTPLDKKIGRQFLAFIEAGGIVYPRIPDAATIKREIGAKRPLLCVLSHWFLHPLHAPRFTFHFNVITGINKKTMFANDPDFGEPFGGNHAHPLDAYLYAIHVSAHGAIDNASLLLVKRKKRTA